MKFDLIIDIVSFLCYRKGETGEPDLLFITCYYCGVRNVRFTKRDEEKSHDRLIVPLSTLSSLMIS